MIRLGNSDVLVNRRSDGSLEAREDLVFHEGPGAVLEMRRFARTALRDKLLAAGFREVHYLLDEVPEAGILFDGDVSQPLIARKEPFRLSSEAQRELLDAWIAAQAEARTLAEQMRMASQSRWLQLGRRFGIGPKLTG